MSYIAVLGSINMDVTINVKNVPQAGQSIYCQGVGYNCGGKGANAAIALSKLGVPTRFFGCIGNDEYGSRLKENLAQSGLDTKQIAQADCASGVAYILVEQNGENRIIVSPGANEAITPAMVREQCYSLIENAEIVLIQLEIAVPALDEIIGLCKQLNKKLVIDAGPVRGVTLDKMEGIFCLSPNQTEAAALVGFAVETMADVEKAAQIMLATDVEHVLIKMGGLGAYYASKTGAMHIPAFKVNVLDTTAAGDSFTAGLCAALYNGAGMPAAIEYASKCGAIAVTRIGASASCPCKADVEQFETLFLHQ